MGTFLRIETHSNILGSTDNNVTYIAVAQIVSVRSNSNGGSLVVYGQGQEINVPELSPDHIMTNCMHSLVTSNLEKDIN